jgi:hypothetical protein
VSWTTEQIADQYRLELRRKFEMGNAAYHAEQAADAERFKQERGVPAWEDFIREHPHYAEQRDSGNWDLYTGIDLQIENNSVRAVLPANCNMFADLLEMFGNISVDWVKPCVVAEMVNGEARLIIELFLVDTWDDDRAVQWQADHPTPWGAP